jgi:RimJ/RimL family protein N-acetyltransferase
MAGKTILETQRLLLREFDEGDVEVFYRLGSDPAVLRYTGAPSLTSLEHALEVLRTRPLADYQKYGYGRWACVLKESGEVIGFCGPKYLDELGEVDLGYWLMPAYWGHGLASEAGRAVLDYAFTRLGLEQIIGLVEPENVASVRVLEKLGLTFTEVVQFREQRAARYVLRARRNP